MKPTWKVSQKGKWPQMQAPQTASWLKQHGSWEAFCKSVHRSIGGKLGSGTIKYAP